MASSIRRASARWSRSLPDSTFRCASVPAGGVANGHLALALSSTLLTSPFTERLVMTVPSSDAYRVIVREVAPSQWEWEILRDNRPLALRLREGLFNSERTAMTAGTAALREFLKFLDPQPVS
jgi:hypothetical protein